MFKSIYLITFLFILTACATRVEYVQTPCPKAPELIPPHNYLLALKSNASPSEYVKACTNTSLSAMRAYADCASIMEGYQ